VWACGGAPDAALERFPWPPLCRRCRRVYLRPGPCGSVVPDDTGAGSGTGAVAGCGAAFALPTGGAVLLHITGCGLVADVADAPTLDVLPCSLVLVPAGGGEFVSLSGCSEAAPSPSKSCCTCAWSCLSCAWKLSPSEEALICTNQQRCQALPPPPPPPPPPPISCCTTHQL